MTAALARPQAGTAKGHAPARNAAIDATRIAGVLAIVWFHVSMRDISFGIAGIFALTAFAIGFLPNIGSREDVRGRLRDRAFRLMLPWVAWCAIYAVLRVGSAVVKREPPLAWADPMMVLYGTWIHLWFLPYLFGVTAILLLADAWAGLKRRPYVLLALGTVLTLAAPWWGHLTRELGMTPVSQWLLVMPALGFGLLLRWERQAGRSRASMALIVSLVLATALGNWLLLGDAAAFQVLLGLGLATAAWYVPLRGGAALAYIGRATMGVYLVHPALIVAANMLIKPSWGVPMAVVMIGVTIGSFAVSFVMLALAPWLLGESRRRAAKPASVNPTTTIEASNAAPRPTHPAISPPSAQ